MSDALPADITLAEAERALKVQPGRLRFAPAVEARFEADTGAARCRRLITAMLIGMVIYLLGLKPNSVLLADVFTQAVAVKLGLIAPLFAVSLWLLARNPAPWLRESVIAAMVVAVMAAQIYLVRQSASPLAAYAHYPAVIDIVFANLILRARFWYALAASLGAFAIYAAGVAGLGSLPFEARLSAIVVLAVGVICTLYANFTLERDERSAYARTLRDDIRSGVLNTANRELSRISNLDALTGLANRRGFDQRFAALWLAAQAAGQPVAVLMIDVDDFKRFNDRYGHQAGDACLREIADTLRAEVRGGEELVARYGGEEFIAVLPGADLLDGLRAAERLRRAVEMRAICHDATPRQIVTASVGIAAAPATMEASPKAIIESADAALYEAKRRGRNRVWPPILSAGVAPGGDADRGKIADVA